MQKTAFLVLENGKVFKGKSFGYSGGAVGELVFNTAMTGYLETLTDPSYYGQIVVQTFPLIGNYGVIPQDFESKAPVLKAYIVKEWCQEPSNFRSTGVLDTFLLQNKIPALCGIDTRELTRIIRENGVMNAEITDDISDMAAIIKRLNEYKIQNAVKSVTTAQAFETACDNPEYTAVLWDFGAKNSIREALVGRSCRVITVPADYTAQQILALRPDGILLSNGPGNPEENTEIIKQASVLAKSKIPMFGIGLGHQILALSQGAGCKKLKYGHRGASQPVKCTDTGKIYITAQNHGYALKSTTLPQSARETFVNVNDGSCEGLCYTDIPAFSVQFYPQKSESTQDTAYLYDEFINLMREGKADAAE